MMTSSKWKKNVNLPVENCLSYNISKSGRKLMTGKRDNLNWTKTKIMLSNKYFFLNLDANMMTLFHFLRVKVVWNRISNSCSLQQWNKNWILRLDLELFRFKKWHVFAHFCIILPIAARAILNFDALARPYEMSRVTENQWKLSIVISGIQIMWKFWISAIYARCARAQRTRGHVRTENFEML